MVNNKKIVIIITYYGSFPWYANYFFHSCKFNPLVDFLIITDIEKPYNLSENIKFVNIPIDKISELATNKLGFQVNIETPYKLCDFKPAYGFLFSDLITNYDFWGHGDLDVIYGNIRNFMTDNLLTNYDVITITQHYISGAFTLFRNSQKTNQLFKLSKDYRKIFSEKRNFSFDETNGVFIPLFNGVSIEDIVTEIESMTHVIKRLQKQKYINVYFNTHVLEGLPGRIQWIEGTMVYKGKLEAMMFHMIMYKHVFKPTPSSKKLGNKFNINAYKSLMFKAKKSESTINIVNNN